MNVKTNKEKVINFEIEKTRYRLGNSDRYIEIDDGDLNLPVRFQEIGEDIQKYFNELKDKFGIKDLNDVNNISTGDIAKDVEELKNTDAFVKEKINYAFGYDVSSVAFGSASCISTTKNGEYYFENFLNAVLPLIEKEFDVRIKKVSTKAQAYIKQKGAF